MYMAMFSIIMPVYNAAKYIRASLNSVLAQTYADWECICVDDGSTDGSSEILDEYAKSDTRVRVVHQPNGGEGSARNAGLALAVGDVIAWIDADDIFDGNVLDVAAVFFTSDASVDLVRVRHRRFVGNDCEVVKEQSRRFRRTSGREAVRKWAVETLTKEGYCWLTFMKRRAYTQPFKIGVQYAGDSLFMLANVANILCVVQSEYIGYYYRDLPTSVMKRPFPSLERARFFEEFRRVQALYGMKHPLFSWGAWFNLVNWCMRLKDAEYANEIHQLFVRLNKERIVLRRDLPVYVWLAFVLYILFGWRWSIRLTYRVINWAIKLRNQVRRGICSK